MPEFDPDFGLHLERIGDYENDKSPIQTIKRKEPRDYQLDFLSRTSALWAKGYKKILCVCSTGGGKSLCGMEACRRALAKGKRCLFIADRCLLVKQYFNECLEYGLNPGIIMSDFGTHLDRPFQVASKDTLHSWAVKRNKVELAPFDLLIFDEAHRSVNESHQDILNLFPKAFVMGLTATPIAARNRSMKGPYDAMVEVIKCSELVRRGFLITGQCYKPGNLDLSGVKRDPETGEYPAKVLRELFSNKALVGDPVSHWKDHLQGRRTFIYGIDREHCADLARKYNKAGIKIVYVDHLTDKIELMEEILPSLAAHDIDGVVSVDLLTEGIDCPPVDGIQIVTAVGSLRKLLQIFGRAMRPSEATGKTDFILLDHGGSVIRHNIKPGEDIEWEFEATERQLEDKLAKKAADSNTPKDVTCPKCHLIHRAAKMCPNCGHIYQVYQSSLGVDMLPGRLVPDGDITGADPAEMKRQMAQKVWIQILYQCANQDTSLGVAASRFSTRMGIEPWKAGVTPLPEPVNGDRKSAWKQKVAEVFPNFKTGGKRRKKATV